MPLRGEAADQRRNTYSGLTNLPGVKHVWIAKHEILGENCIQKMYMPAGREDSVAFAEPRLLNDLDHPRITPLREAQFDQDHAGCVTIVMRVYEGGSVRAAMEAGHRFSVGEVIRIVCDIAEAISYLHVSKRYLHRDLKPGNVLLDAGRKIGYLADFGSAAALRANESTVAAIRTTAPYQPPEVGRTGRVGPAGDIYALGLTAFEMLNGLFPYHDLDARELDRRINAGRRALPDRMLAVDAFLPHVPRRLVQLVRRMINVDSARRPGTASEVVRILRGLQCVDWKHTSGEKLDGEWRGGWPPGRRAENQIRLSIVSASLRGGPDRGKRRLKASYQSETSGGWRSVGVPDSTVDDHDKAAVSAFFTAVDARVARRWPA